MDADYNQPASPVMGETLAGLRVIDLTQNVAGPYCTQILGDLGAEVIKIERPGAGDDTRAWIPPTWGEQSSIFLALNRNKKSICVDLDAPEGQAVVARLAQSADILVHSMKPGSAEARGLGFEQLRQNNRKLIYSAISAFGNSGPLSSQPGYDPLMQAFTGIMSVTGAEGHPPVRVSVSLVDMGCGMWSAMGILAALRTLQRSGEGCRVDSSLLEAGVAWMTVFVANYRATGVLPRKLGSAMSMTAPYELFASADGWVFIAAGNDRLFARVCKALELDALIHDPRFSTNPARVKNRPELRRAIEERTQQSSAQAIVERLRAVGAPCSVLNDVGQMLEEPQVAATGIVQSLPVDEGDHRVVGLPFTLDGERRSEHRAPPRLGADTQQLLLEAGLSTESIDALRERGVIA